MRAPCQNGGGACDPPPCGRGNEHAPHLPQRPMGADIPASSGPRSRSTLPFTRTLPLSQSPARPETGAASGSLTHGTTDHGELALVLTGGGARGAYQVGILRYIANRSPN